MNYYFHRNWLGGGTKCSASSSVRCPFLAAGNSGNAITAGISSQYAMIGGDGFVACAGSDTNYQQKLFLVSSSSAPYYTTLFNGVFFPTQSDNNQNVKLGQSLCTRVQVPTAFPTPVPTAFPTPVPTAFPTPVPTAAPTPQPTGPTETPTVAPTEAPTAGVFTSSDSQAPTPPGSVAAATIMTLLAAFGMGGAYYYYYFVARKALEQDDGRHDIAANDKAPANDYNFEVVNGSEEEVEDNKL